MTSCKYQRLGVLAARQAKVLPLKRCGRASMNRQEETQKARLGVGLLLFSCSPDVTWHTPRPGWRPFVAQGYLFPWIVITSPRGLGSPLFLPATGDGSFPASSCYIIRRGAFAVMVAQVLPSQGPPGERSRKREGITDKQDISQYPFRSIRKSCRNSVAKITPSATILGSESNGHSQRQVSAQVCTKYTSPCLDRPSFLPTLAPPSTIDT